MSSLAGPTAGAPIIEITPTEGQFRQLVRDLTVLRKAGAHSNTAAILEAVRRMAASAGRGYDGGDREEAARRL